MIEISIADFLINQMDYITQNIFDGFEITLNDLNNLEK